MLLPLQTTSSVFLEKKSPALSIIIGCLPLWPSPSWLHSCRPVTSCWSWGPPRSDTSRGSSRSLSTVIWMQLPAFLRALTASWWVAPCMLRPLTWMESGHIIHLGWVKVEAGVRGEGSCMGSLKIEWLFPLQTLMGLFLISLNPLRCESKDWFSIFKRLFICFLFVSLMVALSLREAPAKFSSAGLMLPSNGHKRNISRKEAIMIFFTANMKCVWFYLHSARLNSQWINKLWTTITTWEKLSIAYLQQSISNMDPCLFWCPPFNDSGNKNPLKGNKHIRKHGQSFKCAQYECVISRQGWCFSSLFSQQKYMPALLQQHLPHHGVCKAETPSHQQCWVPNCPSGQTLWSVTKTHMLHCK